MTIYAFQYNGNKHESADATISLHQTRSGAEKAMLWHKEEMKKSWEVDEKTWPDWDSDMSWSVKEYFVEE